ncbi:MAG: hypothetical protein HUJ76_12015, partial [Parasporobacterium sp.]|nr:hypothetical protein [Parasporobacterium sp.]
RYLLKKAFDPNEARKYRQEKAAANGYSKNDTSRGAKGNKGNNKMKKRTNNAAPVEPVEEQPKKKGGFKKLN